MNLELMPLINRVARAQLRRGGATFRNLVAHGHDVHFIDQPGSGSGPTVALLHGLGSSAFAFAQVIPGIAKHARRVIAVDLPGTGFSPVPPKPLGIEACVRMLAALYERELAGQGAVLVGNSLGGAMAAELAGRFPHLVRALMLIAPAGGKVAPERFQQLVQGFELKNWKDGRALMRRLYGSPPMLVPELLAQDMFVNMNRPHVRELLVGERPSDFLEPEILHSLKMPVLLLWARGEKVLPYEGIEYFRAELPKHARIEEVAGWGHIPHLEHPRQMVERVGQFLRELPAS